jgi:signal transduction histidine kinase
MMLTPQSSPKRKNRLRSWWRVVLSFYPQKPSSLAWFKTRPRFYQQLILLLVVAVLTPLAILSLWLYDINDTALRRQMNQVVADFHQNTLNDLQTDLGWQKNRTLQNALVVSALEKAMGTQGHLPSASQLNQWLAALPPQTEALATCTTKNGINTNPVTSAQWAVKKPIPSWLLSQWCQESIEAFSRNNKPAVWFVALPTLLVNDESRDGVLSIPIKALRLVVVTPQHGSSYTLVQLINPTSFLQKIRTYQQQWGGAFTLYNPNNNQVVGAKTSVMLPSDLKNTLLELKEGKSQVLNWKDDAGKKHTVIAAKLPTAPWVVLLEAANYTNRSSLDQARIKTFILIGISFAVSMLLGLFYIFGIIRNFRQLIKGIKAMAQGNYNRRIRLIRNWATPFEIIYVTGEFNRMGRRISEQWGFIQQANQALAKLDEMKSNLIDTVSHELRTPLMNIQGYTSQLMRHHEGFSADQRLKHLKTIRQQTKRLERLVEDLLVIPDLERQALRIYLEPLLVEALVEQTVALFPENKQERLHIEWHLPEGLDVQMLELMADAARLEQVLVNLIENAFKYSRLSESDTVMMTVSLQERLTVAQDKQWVQFSVENPCEQMSEGVLQGLFEKFKRLDESLTRTTRGSGLGLFIAKALTEAMGGEIGLAYHASRSTFEAFIRLPLVRL